MIKLKSSEGQRFVIEETVGVQSKRIERMIVGKDTKKLVLSFPKITSSVLAKVIEYCTKHAEAQTTDEDKKNWDAQFVQFDSTDSSGLPLVIFDMIKAAHYLKIQGLSHLLKQRVADFIKDKTPEEMRGRFAISETNSS
ncbi:hypothetical protein MKW94_007254 [Papaver nudicaule]|uniref:SKP1-like protein n=1 Tax=Papaver nudicaule TaxID=74823 RepID=A0AA41SED3_PAPNU|nr:hypothetical protein [Papaver nudicaule]